MLSWVVARMRSPNEAVTAPVARTSRRMRMTDSSGVTPSPKMRRVWASTDP